MADSDKNIIITPNRGLSGQPEIYFGGSGGVPIRMKVLDDSYGTLSWEGSAGQLFSINNNLTSGSIFSVNDVSGIPSIDVNANGTVSIAGFTGNVGIGVTAPTAKLQVSGNVLANNLVYSVSGITGSVGITAGANVTITQSGQTLTIASSGGGSSSGVTSFNGLTGPVGITAGTNITITQSGSTFTIALSGVTFNRQTGGYTLAASDVGKLVEMNVGSANNLNVPVNSVVSIPVGSQIDVVQYGAGQTTIVAASGVTIRSANNWLKINAQYGAATLVKVGTDEWYAFGNLAP